MGKMAHTTVRADVLKVSKDEFEDDSAHLIDGVADLDIIRSAQKIVAGSNASAEQRAMADIKCGTSSSTCEDDVNTAMDALTSGRTWREKVALVGDFIIDGSFVMPDYTFLDTTLARLFLKTGSNCPMLRNTDWTTNGNGACIVKGGYWFGNGANQAAGTRPVALDTTTDWPCAIAWRVRGEPLPYQPATTLRIVTNLIIKDVYARGMGADGLWCNFAGGDGNVQVSNSSFYGATGSQYTMYFETVSDSKVAHSGGWCDEGGLYWAHGASNALDTNYWGGGDIGMTLWSCQSMLANNQRFDNLDEHGILLELQGTRYINFNNLIFRDVGQSAGTWACINVDGYAAGEHQRFNTFNGIQYHDLSSNTVDYIVRESGTSDYTHDNKFLNIDGDAPGTAVADLNGANSYAVDMRSPSDGDVLTYASSTQTWTPTAP